MVASQKADMVISPFTEASPFYFSAFVNALLNKEPKISQLYPNFGMDANFEALIANRTSNFRQHSRDTLVKVLLKQYDNIATTEGQKNRIQSLGQSNTFTVTTGQQIHLFLGPMYVLYKAIGTIHLANELKQKFPEHNFIPIFWMATEDHDLEEINPVTIQNKQIHFDLNYTGIAGNVPVSDIWSQFKSLTSELNLDYNQLSVFEKAYTTFTNLADATRFIINELLGDQGLLVLDPNDAAFKREYQKSISEDIIEGNFGSVLKLRTQELKQLGFESVIPSKNINHFFIENQQRYRIDRLDEGFELAGQNRRFSVAEMQELITTAPEQFSPNVALRPLYQETILPNLAYVAGPGEVNYWVQLALVFEQAKIMAPALLLRPCVIEIPYKLAEWLAKNSLTELELLKYQKNFEGIVLSKMSDSSSDSALISEFEAASEKILAHLYTSKSVELKNYKSKLIEIRKNIEQEFKQLAQIKAASPEFSAKIEKAKKIQTQYFEAKQPWERKTYLVELMIYNRLEFNELISVPDLLKTPLIIRKVN